MTSGPWAREFREGVLRKLGKYFRIIRFSSKGGRRRLVPP